MWSKLPILFQTLDPIEHAGTASFRKKTILSRMTPNVFIVFDQLDRFERFKNMSRRH